MNANDLQNLRNNACLNALQGALETCAAIRRDMGWTQSTDAARRHARILADIQDNFVPLADNLTAMIMVGAIAGEREAFAAC